VTPPGIDPGTVRIVAQCLNHYATPSPVYLHVLFIVDSIQSTGIVNSYYSVPYPILKIFINVHFLHSYTVFPLLHILFYLCWCT
jgi:hypothetical protein